MYVPPLNRTSLQGLRVGHFDARGLGEFPSLDIREVGGELQTAVLEDPLVLDDPGRKQPGPQRPGMPGVDPNEARTREPGESLGDRPHQQVEPELAGGRDPDALRFAEVIALELRREFESIDLIEDFDLRESAGTHLYQHRVHLLDALVASRIARIDDVQQQRRFARFGQRRLERGHEFVGQFANEADRIGDDDRRSARQRDSTHERIERSEQLIGDVGVCASQRSEQRRLASVRVTDESHRRNRDFDPTLTSGLTLLLQLFETTTQYAHSLAEQTTVRLELGFTGAAKTDTAFLTLEVSPPANETARQMTQLREFHLELALMAARALREDVEDQRIAIEDTQSCEFFEVALLTRRERVIDEDHFSAGVDGGLSDLLRFSATDEVTRIWTLASPGNGDGSADACRLRELRKLLEIFVFDRRTESDANEDGAFAAAGTLKHARTRSLGGKNFRATFSLIGHRDSDVTRRDHRGNGVLVNHLVDGVFE